jgi:copper resistance protein C
MRASTFALAVIGCLLSNAAFAHAHLRAETPAANASVQAPTALTLTFSEGLEPGLTGVVLETSDGASVKTGDVSAIRVRCWLRTGAPWPARAPAAPRAG